MRPNRCGPTDQRMQAEDVAKARRLGQGMAREKLSLVLKTALMPSSRTDPR
jgi:hypothetical protein